MLQRFIFLPILLLLLVSCGQTVLPSGDVIATLPPPGTIVEPAPGIDSGPVVGPSAGNGMAITDLIAGQSDLLFTMTALNATGLWPMLEGNGPFTIFAPSNVAFTKSGLAPQQMDVDELFLIMQNHIVAGQFAADNLSAGMELTTLAGEQLVLTDSTKIAYSPIVATDLRAENGVVHIVDGLILPTETAEIPSIWGVLTQDSRLTQLVSWLEGTDLMYQLRFDIQPDAFLAPSNEAIAGLPLEIRSMIQGDPQLLEMILNYHILTPDGWPGGKPLLLADIVTFNEISTRLPVAGSGFGFGFLKIPVSVNEDGSFSLAGAQIIEGDLPAKNAAVHIVDSVLIPESIIP